MPVISTPDLASLPTAYEAWRASELGQITDQIEEDLVLGLLGTVEGMRVLDVGCGDGALAVRLAALGADVTGVDADPGMLAAARDRAARAQAAVTYVEGDAGVIPFADDLFDVVVALTVLCFVPEASRAFQEMARVLRPGGRLVIGELGRHSLWAVNRRLSGWLGSRAWRSASFRSARELRQLAATVKLHVNELRGAVYYPPCILCARWLAPFDRRLSTLTTTGAAFIILAARKPKPAPREGELDEARPPDRLS